MVRAPPGGDAAAMTSLLARAARETVYLTTGLLTSIVAFSVWPPG